MNNIITNTMGSVNTITETATYQSDPLNVYRLLCADNNHNLLLESAEIDKKHLLKSLLLTNAAVKIVCNGNCVTFSPLSKNGLAAVNFAALQLSDHAELSYSKCSYSDFPSQALTAKFPEVANELDENSRLMAVNPFQSLRLFNQLKNNNNHPFAIFLGGVFAFDMIAISEQLPTVEEGENTCPDFVYYLAETIVVIDHELKTTQIVANVFNNGNETFSDEVSQRVANFKQLLSQDISSNNKRPTVHTDSINEQNSEITTDISDIEFCKIVNDLKENIRAGDIFQVVPSRTFYLPCHDTELAYQELKLSNPSPYMFYLKDSDFCIFGASPESAIKYQQHNRQVEIYPIAGTRPRGRNSDGSICLDLDSRIELELRLDKKELAEHIMLVDLARNDIARVSQAGTRHVADLLKVDRYSHVMHLVSRVCGTLSLELDALHAYQACMNMGTLSGAPKVKATELIRKVEGKRRGSYGGAVGYITGTGEMDTCIVIRSAFVKNGIAQIQAGAGVVYDSDPQSEASETRQKAQAVLNAISLANSKTQGVK
ncbi:MAG: anthranilate synthase component 1 [Colwellia sp.]|nr:anthranilate synthase component 1 [Colwellia sp.]